MVGVFVCTNGLMKCCRRTNAIATCGLYKSCCTGFTLLKPIAKNANFVPWFKMWKNGGVMMILDFEQITNNI